jgi:hypothetical protein
MIKNATSPSQNSTKAREPLPLLFANDNLLSIQTQSNQIKKEIIL